MPENYDEAYAAFMDYVQRRIDEINDYVSQSGNLSHINDIYESLKGFDCDKFIEQKDELIEIDPSMQNDLLLIEFFKEEGITLAEQMSDAMKNILNNEKLVEASSKFRSSNYMSNTYSDMLLKLTEVKDGTASFDVFKSILQAAEISDDFKLAILAHMAYETTIEV